MRGESEYGPLRVLIPGDSSRKVGIHKAGIYRNYKNFLGMTENTGNIEVNPRGFSSRWLPLLSFARIRLSMLDAVSPYLVVFHKTAVIQLVKLILI